MNATTTLTINTPGARTLADARPLIVNGGKITVEFNWETRSFTIFAGGSIIVEGTVPAEITEGKLCAHFAELAMAMEKKTVEIETGETGAVVETEHNGQAYTLRLPARMNPEGRSARTFAERAVMRHLKAQQTPVVRTPELAAAYNRYVSDGLADTDGYFAPKSFDAWARTIG